jgi:hypothetical protein
MNRFAYEMCIAILAIFCLLKQYEVHNLTRTVARQEKHAAYQERSIVAVVNSLEETYNVLEEARVLRLLPVDWFANEDDFYHSLLSAKGTPKGTPKGGIPLHEDATCEDTIELDENYTGIVGRENALPHDDIPKDKVPEDFMQQDRIYKISDKNAKSILYDISREQQYEKRDTWAAIRELQREVAKCTK